MKLTRSFAAASSFALLLSSVASAQSYTAIPGGAYQANDITPDGEIVVGTGTGGAFYWRRNVDPLPTYIGGQAAQAVSDDGSVIAGYMDDPASGKGIAGRWTQATGWVSLGAEFSTSACSSSLSSSWDMNADGTKIVGGTWISGCDAVAFLWEEGVGVKVLDVLGNKSNRPRAISADGTQIVGFAQGNSSRTPARWSASDLLGVVPDMDDLGEYYGLSDDGRFLLGGRNQSAFYELDGTTYDIGGLNPGWSANAVDCSESGGTIVGMDVLGMGSEAWVWNKQSGIVRLQDRLIALGVPGVPALGMPNALTPDGLVVVGDTAFQGAWVVELAPGPGALPYGCGYNNPPESLTHLSGSSSIGSTVTLGVDDPTGNTVAPAFGLVFFSTQPDVNYPCGTPLPGYAMYGTTAELLVSLAGGNPFMQQVSPVLWTGPSQPVPVAFAVPFDLNLFGVDLYAQGALFTPSTLKVGLTNGMRIAIGLD